MIKYMTKKKNKYIFIIIVSLLIIITLYILIKKYKKQYKKEYLEENFYLEYKNNKYCCIYAYYEKDNLYKSNFDYFLKNGILNHVDYYIIINGEFTINIPKGNNINIFKRENIGYDFGAYSYAISKIIKQYEYYFFLNTSVCGPYFKNNKTLKDWTIFFINLFNSDLNTKLVGTTINIYPSKIFENFNLDKLYGNKKFYSHVQTMFFALNSESFEYLKSINFFNEDECNNIKDINEIIAKKEFGLSQHILNKGWNINSILPEYRDLDYRILKSKINKSSNCGDVYYKNAYFGKSIDKYDVIFYKNNRNIE